MAGPGDDTVGYEPFPAEPPVRRRPRRSPLAPFLVAGVLGLLLLVAGIVLGAAIGGNDPPAPRGSVTLDRNLKQVTVTQTVGTVTVVVTR